MSQLPIIFGRTLRKLRHQRKLSQESLAFESDVDRVFISHMEQGKHQPTISTIFKLAKGLNMSPVDLIAYTYEENPFAKDGELGPEAEKFLLEVETGLEELIAEGDDPETISYVLEKVIQAYDMDVLK